MLNSVWKIFEKYFYEQLNQYFVKYNYLLQTQFGFRSNHSTVLAVANVYDYLVLNKDKGNVAYRIFVNLKKAFEPVDHSILLKKLDWYDIRGIALDIICGYLHNRFQYSRINNINSNLKPINCGVSQGSTLGPFLFLIYVHTVNDIFTVTFKTCLFADDTNFTLSAKNIDELHTLAQNELQKINK